MTPSSDQIAQWKAEFGELYAVDFGGLEIIFRTLTFKEFKTFSKKSNSSSGEGEDYILQTVVLHPPALSFDDFPAGEVISLLDQIVSRSCFGSVEQSTEVIESCREEMSSEVLTVMKSFVLATMPAYKEEELDDLTFKEMARKVVLAEQIIELNQGAFGGDSQIKFKLIDPNAEADIDPKKKDEEALAADLNRKMQEALNLLN